MQIHTVSAISYYTHHSFHCPCTGTPLTQVGYASLQIFIKIIIADCINLRWRGLISSPTLIWFFNTAFVLSDIAQGILRPGLNDEGILVTNNWPCRSYPRFIILIPCVCVFIISALFWAHYRMCCLC